MTEIFLMTFMVAVFAIVSVASIIGLVVMAGAGIVRRK